MSFNLNNVSEKTPYWKPSQSLVLEGTLVAIQQRQATEFQTPYEVENKMPRRPKRWPDGNPIWDIRITLATPDGGYTFFQFPQAGKAQKERKKPSLHMDLYDIVLSLGLVNMEDLVGATLRFTTENGTYGQGNPRPYHVQLVMDKQYQSTLPLPPLCQVPSLSFEEEDAAFRSSGNQPSMTPTYSPGQPMQQQVQPQVQPMQQPMQQVQPMQSPLPTQEVNPASYYAGTTFSQ